MALWEYKVITSGKGGFATPQLLENFLNQLGKEEWEIVEFRSAPDNFLAFTGLARRGTQRDWTLEAAAAAAAKAEAEQRRADERAAAVARDREQPGTSPTEPTSPPAGEDPGPRDESFRRPRDTELDQDPEALADEAGAPEIGDWDDLPDEEDLPTLFEAVRPHLRRNQKGPGQSVALDYLAKRWEQEPDDIAGALIECGFTVPETEDSAPDYFEFEGDLYWLNKNNRGQLFLNVREKPRPAFRVTPVRKLDPSDPAAAELVAEHQAEVDRRSEQRRQQEAREAAQVAKQEAAKAARMARQESEAAAAAAAARLPEGERLLASLRPRMRQNRRGGGFSGSTAFLAKALRQPEADLVAALATLGLQAGEPGAEKSEPVELGGCVYWVNRDGRGGLWINGRDKREHEEAERAAAAETEGETSRATGEGDAPQPLDPDAPATEASSAQQSAGTDASEESAEPTEDSEPTSGDDALAPGSVELRAGEPVLPVLRPLLKANRRGGVSSREVSQLASAAGKPAIELLEAFVQAGLVIPDDAKDKAVNVEVGDEIFWLNRNARDESIWLNAKGKAGGRRRPAGRGRKKSETSESASAVVEEGGPSGVVETAEAAPIPAETPAPTDAAPATATEPTVDQSEQS